MASIGNLNQRIEVNASINQASVLAMTKTFEKNLKEANRLAENYIQKVIRTQVLNTFVRALCARAGPGWPEIYTDHLIAVISRSYIYSASLGNSMTTYLNLGNLGDFSDFEAGAHSLALTDEPNNPEYHDHHGYNPHPDRVQLPYKGQNLMNDAERRTEFWERVVIDRDFSADILLRRGKENWILSDHMQFLGYEVQTYNEVALARTLAWGSKAPQWLLLENGSDRLFHGAKPVIYPVDFFRSLELATKCVNNRIYNAAIETLIELAESQGVRVGATGLPYQVIPGRGASFAPYKELLDIKVPDLSICFGSI